jgi:energy-coupling factor transporter transmembrane protein EcfT
MDIGAIDRSATSDLGWLHRTSPVAKLVAFGFVLGAVVATWNIFVVLAIVVVLLAAAVSSRVDLRLALGLAAYPAVFALIFALASAPDLSTGVVIVGKAVTAGLAAVTVILTTPYPQVFAPIQRIVPEVVGDAMLMTYRSLFLLLGKFSNLLRAVRLRAGLRGNQPVRSARAVTQALGGLLLYSLDLSEREYDVMRLRGYSGRLRVRLPRGRSRRSDAAIVCVAGLTFASSLVWRLGWAALNPYSWLLPLPALLLLAVAFVTRSRNVEVAR